MIATINNQDLTSLNSEGYLYIKNFLSAAELSPLMNELVNLAAAFGSDADSTAAFGENVDEAFVSIVKNKKAHQPYLYDRLQLLPQLLRIPSSDKVQSLARKVLHTDNVGVWPRMQLRFDLADDDENLIEWHNDYIYNQGTSYSYTFWLPIVPIDKSMGPVLIVPGSHKKEYTFIKSTNDRRHSFTLPSDEVSQLETKQIEQLYPGDLIIFHSKLVHSGMVNRVKNRARLVCVFRMQNINKLDIFSGEKDD
jgi:ectoine hydroxylase-related dioxygenase (phytanoyl-CoA dioxygenase family)